MLADNHVGLFILISIHNPDKERQNDRGESNRIDPRHPDEDVKGID